MSTSLAPLSYLEAIHLTHPISPYQWVSQGLTVIRDGYDMDGTRIHFVREKGHYDSNICNAHVFTFTGE